MHFKLRLGFLGISVLAALACSLSSAASLTAQAAEEETLSEEVARDAKWLYDKVKEKGKQFGSWAAEAIPDAVETVKEKAPEVIEDVKEAAPEAVDKLKSSASQASEAVSDYREQQQDEFVDWFEQQTGTADSSTSETPSEEANEETATVTSAESDEESEIETVESDTASDTEIVELEVTPDETIDETAEDAHTGLIVLVVLLSVVLVAWGCGKFFVRHPQVLRRSYKPKSPQ